MDTQSNHSLTASLIRPNTSGTSSEALAHDEFVKLMLYLWAAIGRTKEPDKITLAAWYDNLSDLTREQVQNGMRRFIREHSAEFISVQKIRELSGAQQAGEAKAVQAWQLALEAIRIVGAYARPAFSDPVISHTIANLGGWVEFCDSDPDQLRQFTRARFLKTYEAFASTGVMERPARLVCLIDQSGSPAETIQVGYDGGHVRRIGMRAAGTMSVRYVDQPGGLVRTIDSDEEGE